MLNLSFKITRRLGDRECYALHAAPPVISYTTDNF